MKYLQNPPVRRFQSGGPAENPEADYFLTEDDKAEDPTYDPSNVYTGRKRTPYTGNQRQSKAYLQMLAKTMKALGMVKQAANIWNQPGPDTVIMNYDGSEEAGLGDTGNKALSVAGSLAAKMAGVAGWEIGGSVGGNAIADILIEQGIQVGAAGTAGAGAVGTGTASGGFTIPNPAIAALIFIGTKVIESFLPDQTPFIFQKMDFMEGRGGDHKATYDKLMEAGFNGNDSLFDVFKDTVRTPQDYYEFRDKYFVGNFETDTFRKDLGLTDENFFPLEEPEHVMLGDLKIYETGNEEVDLATKELADQFNEYKDEGYSELRVLEELGLTDELDDVTRQYFEQADVKRLEEARASGDEEAYARLLGGMSAAVGELADQRTYEIAAGILTDEETRDILKKRSRYETITQEIFDNVKYKNYDPTVNRDDYNQYETAKEQVLGRDSGYKYSGDEKEIYDWAVKHTTNLVKAG